MARMVFDESMWKTLKKLLPAPKGRHGGKERNFIERFFNRIKHFRCIATRYDKTSIMFMGGLIMVEILIWLA